MNMQNKQTRNITIEINTHVNKTIKSHKNNKINQTTQHDTN